MNKYIIIGVGLVLLTIGIFIGRGTKRCPEPVIITDVIKDTVEANMYRQMADKYRLQADSLRSLPPLIKIKYEIIEKNITTGSNEFIDSLFRAALRE